MANLGVSVAITPAGMWGNRLGWAIKPLALLIFSSKIANNLLSSAAGAQAAQGVCMAMISFGLSPHSSFFKPSLLSLAPSK